MLDGKVPMLAAGKGSPFSRFDPMISTSRPYLAEAGFEADDSACLILEWVNIGAEAPIRS
jgi:hypothetical protein